MGDYRVICDIRDGELVVLVVEVEHPAASIGVISDPITALAPMDEQH
ncbi:MAG: hypothetical protein ACLSDQ_02390 [Adlercreutzia equolifaciens]